MANTRKDTRVVALSCFAIKSSFWEDTVNAGRNLDQCSGVKQESLGGARWFAKGSPIWDRFGNRQGAPGSAVVDFAGFGVDGGGLVLGPPWLGWAVAQRRPADPLGQFEPEENHDPGRCGPLMPDLHLEPLMGMLSMAAHLGMLSKLAL
jgi:hypothetical protein